MPGLVSPRFETVDGLGISQEDVMIVDAGTNVNTKFSGQVTDFTELTLTRTEDGSADDGALDGILASCLAGAKFNVQLVMTHFSVEVYRVMLEGFRFKSKSYPTLDINGSEKLTVNWTATVDLWYKI